MEAGSTGQRAVGIIINPVAGMGGKVGLKGTDGPSAYMTAVALGALPESSNRMIQALKVLHAACPDVRVITCQGNMGEDTVRQAGFVPETVIPIAERKTDRMDTIRAVVEMGNSGIDLLIFAGGDGTARDVASVHNGGYPVIGVPAGVKMQSAVFAVTPGDGGRLACDWLLGKVKNHADAEIMDLDEALYRQGIIASRFHGVLPVPEDRLRLQGKKCRSGSMDRESQHGIAVEVIRRMKGDLFIIGPGTTTYATTSLLGEEGTLIGVDAVQNGRVIGRDLSEEQILALTAGKETKLVITPVGGQGFLLGRGNQQISARVIRQVGWKNTLVAATANKLYALKGKPLRVDTGDDALNRSLCGFVRVITGIGEEQVYPVSC